MTELIKEHVSLAAYTTLGVGGFARYFARLERPSQLNSLVDFSKEQEVPLWVLGGGSNVLVADGETDRLVVKNELKGREIVSQSEGVVVAKVAAGENWDELVAWTVEKRWSGLENLSGIPGTVGAAPIQNINAYGATVADVIESVEVFDVDTKEIKALSNQACQFGYRDSLFKHEEGAGFVVTAVTFRLRLSTGSNLAYRSSSQSIGKYLLEQGVTDPSVADIREAVLWARGNIGMLPGQFASAGSFFKNTIVNQEQFATIEKVVLAQFLELHEQFSPWHWSAPDGREKISTAFLMECSPYNKRTYGEKRIAGVGLSPRHSLSIVAEAGATAAAVRTFANHVTTAVHDIFGVTIEPEVNYVD